MSTTLNGHLSSNSNLSGVISNDNNLSGVISSGGGTTDYNDLENKPQINNVTLNGNKTTSDLGLFSGSYNELEDKPKINGVRIDGNHTAQYYGCASKLNDLTDVTLSNEILDDSVLVYSTVLEKWYNTKMDYAFMINKPTINNVQLFGNLSTSDLKIYTDYIETLTAGNTTITISNVSFTGDETIEVFTSVFGVNPTNIICVFGSITVTFPAQSNDIQVKVRVS